MKSFDDIPIARRISPIRQVSGKWTRSFFLISVFLTIVLIFAASNLIFSSKFPFLNSQKLIKSNNNSSLLGHFPYPEASEKELVSLYPGFQVHRDTYTALNKMLDAASMEGIELILLSGFRTIKLQKQIFYENKSARNQIAIERAKVSAPPGYSEHSTGYAVDFGDGKNREVDFEVGFEFTEAFRWLSKNAARYHFILSFPRGNKQGVSYEPWHWRFEGTVDALRQFEPANQNRRSISSFN